MSDFKIIFVHGYTASSKADWYPNISRELDKLGVNYALPDLPGGKFPHAEEWIETIHQEVVKTRKSLVLVGHSLGTRAVLLYLEKYPTRVEKVFLIAAFANRLENSKRRDGNYADFFAHVINLEKIKPLIGKFIVMHSKDDSSIPYKQGVEIAKSLNAQLFTYTKNDHFSDPDNASYILEVLKKELWF